MTRADPLRLFMTTDAVGGVWTYALDLSRALAAYGVTTTLAVLGPEPRDAQRADALVVPGLDLRETGLPLDWTAENPDEVGRAGRAVAALAANARPDIIHLNSPALAAEGRFDRPVVAACHSCVATWWRAVRGGPLPADFAWRTDLTRRGYEAADLLLAPTRAFADATADAYDLGTAPRVVPNGRRPLPSMTRSEGAPDGPFVFTAGRLWDEGKNVRTLDRSAARLGAPVLAAGWTQGPHGSAIALDHVRAVGSLGEAEIAGLLAARPVYASLALYEPFGLAVLEAAQAGCPLVLSDIPTFRELWDGAALFVPPEDEVAVVEALDHVLADAAVRTRLGEAASERARRYTVDAMADGMLRLYHSLLQADIVTPAREGVAA